MAILKRINKYQGLKDIDVLVEESGLSSRYFNIYDVPSSIPQGRSSFLLAGSPFLKNFVELKVEILDSAGHTIYTEPVANYIEGNARRVTIEVYDDTAPGDGFLYIVGELKDNYRSVSGQQQSNTEITDKFLDPEILSQMGGNDIPPDFQNVYNVRYIRPIFINTVIPNSEPIFFYQQPRVTVSEIVKGYVTETTVSSSYEVTGSVSVDPIQGLESKDPEPDPIDGFSKGVIDGAREEVGAELEIFKNRRKSKIDPLRNNRFSKSGRITRRASPEIDRFTITVDQLETSPENTTSDAVTSAFIGGEVTIKNPKVNTTEYPTSEYEIPTEYTSKIKKVNNEKTLVPLDDFVITKKDTGEKIPVKIEQGGEGESSSMEVTMSAVPTPPQVISTTHYRSFADITVGNLGTFSGDVYKAKIYARSKGTLGDFEPVYDASIESPQVLIDSYSPTGFKNTGYFYTQSIVDDYWVSSSNSTATQDNSVFIDGVLISGSNEGFTPQNSTANAVILHTSQSYNLEKSVPYTIEFNAYYYKSNKLNSNGTGTLDAELEVFLSGSAITGGTEEDYKLGKVTVNKDESEGRVLGVHNTFTSAGSGSPNTHLKFKATSGRWIIQDIVLRPHSETNFNPDYFRTVLPMPHPMPKKPDTYDFLVEFYDLNNNIAETISVREDVVFAGAPINIEGDGNLLSGSLYLGGVQGEGIEVHGGSAYLRSLTYEGFDKTIAGNTGGFMMWSGSVADSIDSSEAYQGVGLEIVDAHGANDRYLQFKTNPSTFKVQTDEFFLGLSTSTFVSGSNGNLHISSSNFEIQPDGDVIMAGTITATAGNIGDWTISNGDIVGSNITMDADNSTIYKTDQGPGSDSGAAFDQLRDEYYIDFTPEEESPDNFYIKMGPMFMVDKDGILIASGATFEGSITASQGLIGGFTTDSHSFYSSNIFISGSPAAGGINQDKYMFISTSNWNVKQDGQQTGSDVLFTGGKIAGWNLTDGYIYKSISGSAAYQDYTRVYLSAVNDDDKNIGEGFTVYRKDEDVEDGEVKIVRVGGLSDITDLHANNDYGIQVIQKDSNTNYSNVMYIGESTQTISGWNLSPTRITSAGDDLRLTSTNPKITIGTHTFEDGPGIQLGFNSSKVEFYAGDGDIEDAGTNYLKFHEDTGVDIKTANFELDTATLDISSTDRRISLGSSDDIIIIDADDGIQVGDATFNDAEFSVDIRGNLRAVSGSIAGWAIDTNKIFKDNIQLQSNNSIISIGGTTFGSAGVQLQYDSQGKFYAGDGSNNRIQFDSSGVDIKTTKFELDTPTIDISTTNRRFQVFGTGSNAGKEYIRLGEISTDSSDKYGLKVYSGEGTGSAELIAMFGEIGNKIAGWEFTNTQMRSIPVAGLGGAYDFDAGEDGIIIQSNVTESRIETAGFVSGLKGFRMSSLGNGSAEFENMRIRGTLRTTVFEKESVNVVGGQLMVANSTTIQALKSGSVVLAGASSVTATDVTMSVANASGFSRGEILKVKGVDDTGFSVEYLYVTGSKRFSEDGSLAYLTGSEDAENNAPPLDPDGIAGELYVGRGYGSTGPSQISSSISVLSAGISLNEGGGEPEFGTIDTISVDATGSLAIQDILKIDEEKMKITAIAGTGTAASASLTVVRDFQDTLPSIHNAGTTVYKFNPDMQFLAGLVSSARPYQEGQVLVSTGKYASGTGYHDKFSYNANVSDTPNANGEYRILSGSTHITTNVTGSTHLEIYKIDKDAVDHNSLFSLFDKSSYIVILIDGTDEWVRFRVSGNPTVAGNVHTYPISLNQDFYQVQTPATDTTSDDVDFWFLSNIQDVSSGYIMMNANPNDPYSPYMDFVERTGPDVYDLQLRTRLGDLSGLSSAYLYGEEEPGFGLYTENGFFRGTLHAMTGSIHGILNVATQQGGIETGQKITIGRGVDGTHDGFRINNNNYWFTTGEFRVGDATNYFHVSGTEASIASDISIKTDDLNIDTTNFDVSTDNGGSIALGSLTNVNPATTNKGFYTSGSGATLIKGSATSNDDYVLFDTNGVQIRTQDVSIVTTGTNKLKIDSTGTPQIAMGATLPTAYNSGTGFFVDGTGNFLVGVHDGNRIQYSSAGGAITMVSDTFSLDAGSASLDSTSQQLKFADDASALSYQGNGIFMGKVGDVYKMSLKSASGGSLSWDGAGTLAITGNITISNFDSAYGSAISGSIAGATGSLDSAIASASASAAAGVSGSVQAIGDALVSSASAAAGVSGSVLASAAASDAQNAIDSMETQLVLDSSGMTISSSGGPGTGYGIAKFGTTTTFWDGTDDEDANRKLQLSAQGVYTFGDDTDTYTYVRAAGVQVVSSSVEVADFGATTTIGNTSTDHVEITNSSLKLKSGSFAHVAITPAGMQIGSVGNGITLDSAGSATFHGSITITGPQIASLTGSVHNAAVAAQDTADTATDIATAVANVTASLENETTFTPSTAAGTADGLHLGSDKLGFVQSSVWKTYMDNSGNFYLGGTSGALTWTAGTSTLDVNRITATTGTIGDFDIGTSTLESSNDKLILDGSADGKIRLGASPPPSATSGTGIFLGGDGTFLAGASAGNRIQFTGGSVVIQSNTFALNTNTMILDSGVNSGKISLGASGGPTSVDPDTIRRGIYMDGTGDVLIKASGSANDAYMKFTTAGLEIKTANLTFDTDGNITSQEYLIERSRLFGSGVDAEISIQDNGNTGSTYQDSSYGVWNATGTAAADRILLNGPERASQGATYGTTSPHWHQLGDIYCENFTIAGGVTLWTNGFRIFVRNTLTIESGATIRNDGFDGANGGAISIVRTAAGKGGGNGTGAPDGTLAPGTDGSMGGAGGVGGSQHGCSGGAGGGSGGPILIFARILAGSGAITVQGGDGGDGGTSVGMVN